MSKFIEQDLFNILLAVSYSKINYTKCSKKLKSWLQQILKEYLSIQNQKSAVTDFVKYVYMDLFCETFNQHIKDLKIDSEESVYRILFSVLVRNLLDTFVIIAQVAEMLELLDPVYKHKYWEHFEGEYSDFILLLLDLEMNTEPAKRKITKLLDKTNHIIVRLENFKSLKLGGKKSFWLNIKKKFKSSARKLDYQLEHIDILIDFMKSVVKSTPGYNVKINYISLLNFK